jgi:xanthine dehydrogenase large subunit
MSTRSTRLSPVSVSMAVASVADYRECPRLDAPATPERILAAVEDVRRRAHA